MPKKKKSDCQTIGPIEINLHMMELDDRRSAADAIENSNASPMEFTHHMERSAALLDLGISAGIEAGILLKQGIAVEEIPVIIEKKYGEQIPEIRDIIAQKISER